MPSDRFDLWRESVSVVFDCQLKNPPQGEPFHASLDALLCGQIFLSRCRSHAAFYHRTPAMIRRDGQDQILIQLFLKGQVESGYRQRTSCGQAGDLFVFDLSREVEIQCADFEHISLVIPREEMEALVPDYERWHGRTLPRTPAARLLSQHLVSSHELGREVGLNEAPALSNATLELATLAFRDAAREIDFAIQAAQSPAVARALTWEIKQYVREHLRDPKLSATTLAQRFGISRAQLFRQFDAEGGPMGYVREQRLRRAVRDLEDPRQDALTVAEIAFQWGFGNATTFSRRIKLTYGLTPTDLRAQSRHNNAPGPLQVTVANQRNAVDRRYEEWLLALRS